MLLTIAASLLVSWGARRLRLPAAVAWAGSVVGMVWFLSLRFFGSTLALIIPTGETFTKIADAWRDGARAIYTDSPPVEPSDAILLYVAAGIWLTSWLVDASAITLENPLLGMASALPLFLVAGSLTQSNRLWVEAGVFILASAWMLYAHERARQRRLASGLLRAGWRLSHATVLAVIVATIAVLLAPALPGFGSPPAFRGRGGNVVTFNPFVAIRPTLANKDTRLLFVVRSPIPVYHRLATVEHYDGRRFSHRDGGTLTRSFGAERPMGTTLDLASAYRIVALGGPWLPAPYQAVSFDGVPGTRIELGSGAIFPPKGAAPNVQYQVESSIPSPSRADLDVPIAYDTDELAPYLGLPTDEAARLRPIARSIVGDAQTPYLQAARIQSYLRRFTYDENVAARHSFNDIYTFLTRVRRGYCEQFAASMAVLTRALGIPSRVVIGFAPGRARGDVFSVTTRDAHSWVEVYFPQSGWVSFEPTPRSGFSPPEYTIPRSPSGQAEEPVEQPTTEPTSSASSSPNARPFPTEAPSGSDSETSFAWMGWLLVPVALIVIPGGLIGFVALRRRARFARARTKRGQVAARYVDFLEWCAAAGYPLMPGETPREVGARIGSAVPAAAAPMGTLAALVEEALWAPPNGLDTEAAVRAADDARRAINATLTKGRKVTSWIRLAGRRAQ